MLHRFRLSRTLIEKFEHDPGTQYRIHITFTYLWLVNMVAASLVFFLAPDFWGKYSIFYILFVSLYANFATDYDAVSAAQASEHGLAAVRQGDEQNRQLLERMLALENTILRLQCIHAVQEVSEGCCGKCNRCD